MKSISKIKLYLSCIFLVSGLNAFAQDPNFHIYLCFGQSNMAGAGHIETQDQTVDPRFQFMYPMAGCNDPKHTFGKWYPAVPPLWGCNSGGLGPSDYFGRTMVQNLPTNIKIGVIVVAIPGCDIRLFDKTGYKVVDTGYIANYIPKQYSGAYAWLMDLAKLAQHDGVIKGFLMHQGETMPDSTLWPGQVKRVYDSLISDLKLDPSKTPLLAGEMLYKSGGGSCESHNVYVAKLPQLIPNSYVISASGLVGQDQYHFTAASQRTFGARYAQKMISLETSAIRRENIPVSDPTLIPVTYKNGLMQIKMKGNFSYRITNLCGEVIKTGNSSNAFFTGIKLTPGIYLVSVNNEMKCFSGKVLLK